MAEDRFLSRWARRKHAAASGTPEADPQDSEQAAISERAAAIEAERAAVEQQALQQKEQEEANRLAAEAIDLENADETTDFTAFLKDGVPALLRQQALRKLWRLNPVFANIDGLNDYDDDFATLGKVVGKVDTRWQIGKGYEKAKELLEQVTETGDSVEQAPASGDVAGEAINPLRRPGEGDMVDINEPDAQREAAAINAEVPPPADPADDHEASPEPVAEPVRVSLRRRMALDDWNGEG